LRTQVSSIEQGLSIRWQTYLLNLARSNQLPHDFTLEWDRAGHHLRTPFFPIRDVGKNWTEYRALKPEEKEAKQSFLRTAMQIQRSWDRVLAIQEWRSSGFEQLPIQPEGYETTILNPEAHSAYEAIFSLFAKGRDFTFARRDADFFGAFFHSTENGELEAYLPSVATVQNLALKDFEETNHLSGATFGANALDIHFPQLGAIADSGYRLTDSLFLALSAAFLAIGVGITFVGVRRQKNLLSRRVSFLNQVVHELKTPLAGLKLNAQLIRRYGSSEQNLNSIETSIMRLDRLFDDIVQINRPLETNVILHRITAQSLNSILHELAADSKLVHILASATLPVISEQTRLNFVLRNLIINGLKYGHEVFIHLVEDNEKTLLEVRDIGSGISVRDQKQIFSEFFRSDDAKNQNVDGLGLGLALAKKLSGEMSATLSLKNPGQAGAIFVVTLRRATDDTQNGSAK